MTKPPSVGASGRRIFWPLPRWSLHIRASLLAAVLMVLPGMGRAQDMPPACQDLMRRFNLILDRYHQAGANEIANGEEPGAAIEKARARALKGDPQATIALVGVTLAIYGRRDMFPVSIVRQVCNLAARNALPLHVAACAYFNALNPIGEKDDKRKAVEVEIERFDKARKAPPTGTFAPPDELGGHMDALKACLPRA